MGEPRNCLTYLLTLHMKLLILYRKDNSKLSVIHWILVVVETNLKRFAKTPGYPCLKIYRFIHTHTHCVTEGVTCMVPISLTSLVSHQFTHVWTVWALSSLRAIHSQKLVEGYFSNALIKVTFAILPSYFPPFLTMEFLLLSPFSGALLKDMDQRYSVL